MLFCFTPGRGGSTRRLHFFGEKINNEYAKNSASRERFGKLVSRCKYRGDDTEKEECPLTRGAERRTGGAVPAASTFSEEVGSGSRK